MERKGNVTIGSICLIDANGYESGATRVCARRRKAGGVVILPVSDGHSIECWKLLSCEHVLERQPRRPGGCERERQPR